MLCFYIYISKYLFSHKNHLNFIGSSQIGLKARETYFSKKKKRLLAWNLYKQVCATRHRSIEIITMDTNRLSNWGTEFNVKMFFLNIACIMHIYIEQNSLTVGIQRWCLSHSIYLVVQFWFSTLLDYFVL